jgi:drug/metabolite transporter superfamily protein YnfA
MQAFGTAPGIAQLAGYAAFGGLYFLLSALWLAFRNRGQSALFGG